MNIGRDTSMRANAAAENTVLNSTGLTLEFS